MTSAPSGSRDPSPPFLPPHPLATSVGHLARTLAYYQNLLRLQGSYSGERKEGVAEWVRFWLFLRLGFMARQVLMGIALVGQTTGEEGEVVTVNTETKRGALIILAPS